MTQNGRFSIENEPLFLCLLAVISLRIPWVLPERTEELTRPSQKRLRLNKDKCLLPGANHCGHNDQEKPIGLAVCRSVDLARQHEQVVSQQGVLRQQLGFSSRQSGKRAQHKGSRRWVEPARNPFVERVKAQADWSPNGDEHRPQEWKRSFKQEQSHRITRNRGG